jgi:hypothetical protein
VIAVRKIFLTKGPLQPPEWPNLRLQSISTDSPKHYWPRSMGLRLRG